MLLEMSEKTHMIRTQQKFCNKCNQTKKADEFYKTDRSMCKECKKEYTKEKYKDKKEKGGDKETQESETQRYRKKVVELERKIGKMHELLEKLVDHLDSKKFNKGDEGEDDTIYGCKNIKLSDHEKVDIFEMEKLHQDYNYISDDDDVIYVNKFGDHVYGSTKGRKKQNREEEDEDEEEETDDLRDAYINLYVIKEELEKHNTCPDDDEILIHNRVVDIKSHNKSQYKKLLKKYKKANNGKEPKDKLFKKWGKFASKNRQSILDELLS